MKIRQRGFGLVELMISITLGLVLSAAVIQVFIAARASTDLQDALSQTQENARFAMRYVGKEIRMAGYMGCRSLGTIPVNNIALPATEVDFSLATAVIADNDVDGTNAYNAVAGTDILHIKRGSDEAIRLTGNLAPNNANVQVEDNSAGFAQGDYVLITDCLSADIFRIVNSPKEPGEGTATFTHAKGGLNSDNKLSKIYGADAEIFALETLHFYVRDTGRVSARGDAINSLYAEQRLVGSSGVMSSAIELVEGVEDMQLQFGVDTDVAADRAVDQYLSADAVTDWGRVLSVRITLQLYGSNSAAVKSANPQQYVNAKGEDSTVSDGRLRRVFTNVFAIRNKLP